MNVTIQVDWWTVFCVYCGLMYVAAILIARRLIAGNYDHDSDEDRLGVGCLLVAAPIIVPIIAAFKVVNWLYDAAVWVIGLGVKKPVRRDSFGQPFGKPL